MGGIEGVGFGERGLTPFLKDTARRRAVCGSRLYGRDRRCGGSKACSAERK